MCIRDSVEVEFVDMPDFVETPNRYGWNFSALNPGETVSKAIKLLIPGPVDFPIGDNLTFNTQFEYSDFNTSSEIIDGSFEVPFLCAYDPNDKLVQPVHFENYSLIDEALIYTVRFQNTGSAEAFDVQIVDELDSNLDRTIKQRILC